MNWSSTSLPWQPLSSGHCRNIGRIIGMPVSAATSLISATYWRRFSRLPATILLALSGECNPGASNIVTAYRCMTVVMPL